MLVLTRRMGESICVAGGVTITVLSAQNGRARIGIDAPPEVAVHRSEIQQKIEREEQKQRAPEFSTVRNH